MLTKTLFNLPKQLNEENEEKLKNEEELVKEIDMFPIKKKSILRYL